MKTGKIKNPGVAGYYNVLAVDANGSPISSQVWSGSGSVKETALRLLDIIRRGDDINDQWAKPIVHAYIHSTATGDTFFYDLSDTTAMTFLLGMAKS